MFRVLLTLTCMYTQINEDGYLQKKQIAHATRHNKVKKCDVLEAITNGLRFILILGV